MGAVDSRLTDARSYPSIAKANPTQRYRIPVSCNSKRNSPKNTITNRCSLLDPFGLYVYGIVLKERKEYRQAQEILVESILVFPYNWSALVDLVDAQQHASSCSPVGDAILSRCKSAAVANQATTADVEQQLDSLHSHFMYQFVCGYFMSERQLHADTMVVYERWVDSSLFCGYLLSQHHRL